jgi:hypothetical protein
MGGTKQNIALEAKFQQDYRLVMNEFVTAAPGFSNKQGKADS